MDQDELQQIDRGLESLPSEAKDFLYHGPYTAALQQIGGSFSLTEEQKGELDMHITQVIILIEHRIDLINYIATLGFPPEKQQSLLSAIEQTIIMPIVAATNYIEEDIETEEPPIAPSPTDVLDTLKNRLTTTQTTAPTTRRMDIGKSAEPAAPAALDPYREIPT